MKERRKLLKQAGLLLLVAALLAGFNLSIYKLLTGRLSNNFSDATKSMQIDVSRYLPFEADSDLPRLQSSLKLTEDLPVLDGAAALVPVYAAIVDGTTDILFCAGPSAEQKAYAQAQGVELVYVPVGLEAFVFFVNGQNPVENLTTEQIRGIYSGEYTNWAQLGGANRIINPVTRLAGSGSQSAMEAFMGDVPIAPKSPLAITGASIGFSFRFYMDGIVGNKTVKMLSLDGVYPSAENIRNGSYPIIAKFYAIYRADNDNPNIPVLIDWLLSGEGQQLIEACGYIRIC